MQCDICAKKKATVHLTEIVDEQMSEMHLCEDCARQKSVQMEQQFGLADLLAGLADFGKQVKESGGKVVNLKCTNCGLNYEDFRKLGRLGCGDCYVSFREQLDALLKKIHGSNQHLGKSPLQGPQKFTSVPVLQVTNGSIDGLEKLKQDLQQAIKSEDFEKAAALRDKIRGLDKKT